MEIVVHRGCAPSVTENQPGEQLVHMESRNLRQEVSRSRSWAAWFSRREITAAAADDIFFFAAPYCRVNPIKSHERPATHDGDECLARAAKRAETRDRSGATARTAALQLRFISSPGTIKGFRRSERGEKNVSTEVGRPARKQTKPREFSLLQPRWPERFTSRKPLLIGRSRFFFFLLDQQTVSGVSPLSQAPRLSRTIISSFRYSSIPRSKIFLGPKG